MEESDKIKLVLTLLHNLQPTRETVQQLVCMLRISEGLIGGISHVVKVLKVNDVGVDDGSGSEAEVLAELAKQLKEQQE